MGHAKSRFAKHVSYLAQSIPAYLLYGIFQILPLSTTSALGGLVGRCIGRFHKSTRRAYANLQLVLPERAAEHRKIVRDAWDNLGRVMGEYARFRVMMLDKRYVEMIGYENVPAGGSVVFITAHLANWEVCRSFAAQNGWPMASVYRPLNNFYLDPLLRRLRTVPGQTLLAKHESARSLIKHVKAGESVGIVCDQRLSDGVSLPFFGQPALTSTMAALLAVRYGGKIVPAQVERLPNGRLRLRIHPVLQVPYAATEQDKVDALTTDINNIFEGWIRENPGQWLWMHDRWRPAQGGQARRLFDRGLTDAVL